MFSLVVLTGSRSLVVLRSSSHDELYFTEHWTMKRRLEMRPGLEVVEERWVVRVDEGWTTSPSTTTHSHVLMFPRQEAMENIFLLRLPSEVIS